MKFQPVEPKERVAVKIVCIGGAHIDCHGVLGGPLVLGTSNPGSVTRDFDAVLRHLQTLQIDTSLVGVSARPTKGPR